jgi:hypothetical protein
MAFNGSGTFTRIYNWVVDKANGINITASRMDTEFDGIATGLSTCITKDGQTTLTANIPFANYKITGLGNGTARSDAINVGQVQDNQFLYLGTTTGSADAYTLSPAPTIAAYATTQQFVAKIHTTNATTTPYLQISGIANPASTAVIKKLNASRAEVAVEASDLLANGIYKFQRNSANDAWIVLNPEKPFINLLNGTKATTTTQGISYLNNPITISNNATDANNDIDFSAGNAPLDDGSGQVLLSSIIVKRLDASWVAGTNQGGLFSGTKANSTKYYLFAITNGTINDAGFDISPTGANIPSGYKGSYRGMVKTDSSGNILAFKQTKNKFLLASQITEYSGTVGATYTNLTSTNVPLKSEIEAIVNLYLDVPTSENNGRAIIFKDLISNQQKQVILSKPASTIVLFSIMPDVLIGLNSSGQFQYKSTDASTGLDNLTTGTFQIKLNGWIDNNIKL